MLPLWGVIIGLALIIINAWFAAARKSISESNKTKLRELAEDGNSKAKAVLPVLDKSPESKLSTRVLNVIIYMIYCLVCMVFLAAPLYLKFEEMWESEVLAAVIAFIIVFFIALIFLMALGEMLPRRIAMQHAEGVLMATAGSIKAVNVSNFRSFYRMTFNVINNFMFRANITKYTGNLTRFILYINFTVLIGNTILQMNSFFRS